VYDNLITKARDGSTTGTRVGAKTEGKKEAAPHGVFSRVQDGIKRSGCHERSVDCTENRRKAPRRKADGISYRRRTRPRSQNQSGCGCTHGEKQKEGWPLRRAHLVHLNGLPAVEV